MNAQIEFRLEEVLARQARDRTLLAAERAATRAAPPVRRQVGESLIRLGHRVAGTPTASTLRTG